jgi:Ca-activated chloride channel family protein
LTENLGVASDALKGLRPGDVQPGGTNLAAGVGVALDLLAKSDQNVPRTIVLFTDGEDLTGSWPSLVARLRQQNVTLHGVAIGDVEMGHPVPSVGGKPLRFEGQVVESRRNDTPIEALAAATEGSIVRPGLAPVDLAVLFEKRIKPFAVRRREELRRETERADQHVPFVFAAFAVGVSACRPRRFRAAWAIWPLLLIFPGASPTERSTAEWIRKGKVAYDGHDLEAARDFFARALRSDPHSTIASYDAAATAFQAGRFDEALRLYEQAALLTKDPGLRMKIQYAVGNTRFALGQSPDAIRAYDACIASTVKGPKYDAIRRDAAINRRFAMTPPKAAPREDQRGNGTPPDSQENSKPGENPSQKPESPQNSGDSNGGPPAGSDASAGAEESTDPQSARERFQAALYNARQARDFRPSDDGPPPRHGEILKDW